ncbi:phosphoglycerate mutase-like protein [Aspergillus japonicus CBS 114.51]|uniref:Phosphoglycerate mutase-like protein n=1 Tax=Aspergillus japonicus CBS 114.51 TaxID=1448312 RepID=A0A8T8WUP3_ASPJA|nr:phosphoglycerate mutase-like protein [Aspergillus japonicus CBS 114.51]RAH79049.1 phosphoglycerate mutase-like protein [Aspergillus japonicus CBS 114.51]
MPLDTIYLTRHGHRLNWTIDYKTGTYHAQFPTPTGNPADPTLTSHGVRQSHELAAHLTSDSIHPKPFRVYCSPFYRCLQTIQPSVEALKALHQRTCSNDGTSPTPPTESTIEPHADFDVRIENGLGEWFGHTTFFEHPQPAPHSILATHFPTLLPLPPATSPPPSARDRGGDPFSSSMPPPTPHVIPSPTGETIAQLHDRVATALSGILADVDAEIAALEAAQPAHEPRSSKAILICSHAAPLIAMGRALTGHMPPDPNTEDFAVFTAGLSTFRRRRRRRRGESGEQGDASPGSHAEVPLLARGTKVLRTGTTVPEWRGGKGVAGGWDCVRNGDCGFLSQGAERGWHFDGEEGFDTGPMAPEEAGPTSSLDIMASADGAGERGTKL